MDHPRLFTVWALVYRGSLPGPTSVPSDAQARWHRKQSANPVCAVGASPVVSSAQANVFVSLSKPIVILVFCDMLEYLHFFVFRFKIPLKIEENLLKT